MAQPLRKNQPLVDVLTQIGLTTKEMNQMLQDGADEAERLIPKLIEKHTTGSKVKAAQLTLVLRELKVAQSALWGDLGASLRQGVAAAGVQGFAGAQSLLVNTLAKNDAEVPGWQASLQQQAQAGIAAILAKATNGIPLARSVYQTQALATGLVNRRVIQGLLLGNNAKTIAKSVKDLIRPDVAGGVSYAASRLARTEINNAYKTAQQKRYEGEPWTKAMHWNLSKSHPGRDVCNTYAEADDHDLGEGNYPVGQAPISHPNCLCYLTPETIDEDEFVDKFVAGEYNTYIDSELQQHAPKAALLCP